MQVTMRETLPAFSTGGMLGQARGGSMSGEFTLLDLSSQAIAVQQLLRGRSTDEKLEWLRDHGELAAVPMTAVGARPVYAFKSVVGLSCAFFIDGEKFVFFGDHTTYTIRD
jgi:hypothetical protein